MPTNNIVTVNVSQQVAPAPSTLQQTGAVISQGSTTLPAGADALITQMSDLTPLLVAPTALSSLAFAGGVVTATASTAHGLTIGQTYQLTIAGAVPAGYNGTFTCTITTTTAFTYPLAHTPGTETSPGTYTSGSVTELVAAFTTFFAQGQGASAYVLELGAGTAAAGVAALETFINAGPQFFYAYLVPKAWSDEATFLPFLQPFEGLTAKTYFWTTMTTSNYTDFNALQKCVKGFVEAPGTPPSEFTAAADFYQLLQTQPSATSQVGPFAFRNVFGVTPYPMRGNSALLAELKTAGVNVVLVGAEGGVSNTYVYWGTMMDGRDGLYWYSVDWVQINIQRDLANEVLNGSNDPLAPLYYDQNGINRLQARALGTMTRGVTFGLVLSPVSVTATPFRDYVVANPDDFPAGIYNGLGTTYTPNRGFTQIIFNIVVSDFPVSG